MNNQYVKTDRFGNAYQLIGCKPNKNDFPVGYIELGGKLYKLEPSKSKNDKYLYWIKVTKVNKQNKQTSM
jgi:hypothetical protein